ncbi:MAG TPA: hypothetical protein VN223_10155, partial [Candidatus Elarobacter sp.]|nr:hypothetical protein [Candidatus Elarobacter sp.]
FSVFCVSNLVLSTCPLIARRFPVGRGPQMNSCGWLLTAIFSEIFSAHTLGLLDYSAIWLTNQSRIRTRLDKASPRGTIISRIICLLNGDAGRLRKMTCSRNEPSVWCRTKKMARIVGLGIKYESHPFSRPANGWPSTATKTESSKGVYAKAAQQISSRENGEAQRYRYPQDPGKVNTTV